MVWFFSKADSTLRLETTFDNRTREYVLKISWPDRPESTERFADVAAFQHRSAALERELSAGAWRQVGGPEILPDGWRGPIPH
jgi:hypothetical protein